MRGEGGQEGGTFTSQLLLELGHLIFELVYLIASRGDRIGGGGCRDRGGLLGSGWTDKG